ncbi:SMI1/KNR4 family protein [Streptomyces sp. NPDC050658]|uniref:SMI1/KNR4 family protein n=1 Tax=unclassified Streptomyces TaxID=2593676 RepID=UPI00343225A5
MVDRNPAVPSVHDFATWGPVLELMLAAKSERPTAAPTRLAGRIGRDSWNLALRREATPQELKTVERVRSAVADTGVDDVWFTAKIEPTGETALRLRGPSPAVVSGTGNSHPGTLILVEGALSEPWRRLPDPAPGAVKAPSADPELLERTLRERLPDAIGATEDELAQVEARLGFALPEELRVLYGVTRGRWWEDCDDGETADRFCEAVGCELAPVDRLYVAGSSTRDHHWEFAATEAVDTPPHAAVQGLAGSPGWIVFGENGGGDGLAVDLTPGPRGHIGQIILIGHEGNIGAELIADSLTDLVLNREREEEHRPAHGEPPLVARVNAASLQSIAEAAHPGLEVLCVGVWEAAPLSLAPVAGLPRLRTLTAYPDTLADPLEIAGLPHLEFLQLGPREWRVLLDAEAVPRSLLAAAITLRGEEDPAPSVAVAGELLALWGRPQIIRTRLEGTLAPAEGLARRPRAARRPLSG